MLKKLLKYEMKSTMKFGLPLLIAILGGGLIVSLSMIQIIDSEYRVIEDYQYQSFSLRNFFAVGLCFIMMMLVVAAVVALFSIILVRYYKSMTQDEGYLTFTLPVKVKSLIGAKILNAFIWIGFTIVTLAIAVVMIVTTTGIAISRYEDFRFVEIFEETYDIFIYFLEMYVSIYGEATGRSLKAIMAMKFINVILSPFSMMIEFFAIISFVCMITKKHKILYVILIFFGVGVVQNVIMSGFQAAIFNAEENATYITIMIVESTVDLLINIGLAIASYFIIKTVSVNHLNLD